VYVPLRRRGWTLAVLASNAAGLVVDSVLFLALAFGSLEFLPGQIVGKAWMTLAAIGLLLLLRSPRSRAGTQPGRGPTRPAMRPASRR
jgi:queuosine precursor transporter